MMERNEMSIKEMKIKLADSLESIGFTGDVQVEERGREYLVKVAGYENFIAYPAKDCFLLELVHEDRKNAYGTLTEYIEALFLSLKDFKPLKYGIFNHPMVQMLDISTGEYEYSTGRKKITNLQEPILPSDFKELRFNPC